MRKEKLLDKLKVLDSRARRKGFASLDPEKNSLIGLGMEIDGRGHVTKNGYGVFNLSWQSESHTDWAKQISGEIDELKKQIRRAHKVPLRYVIWAGMGGSAEDKAMYNAVGLLKRGPKVYVLDSTDPAKLKYILEDITKRSGSKLAEALKSTLVVGMAMGMTSYEPVVNFEKLAALYSANEVDSAANFVYMTLPDSLLDRFGKQKGYRRIELQLDSENSTAGRHSAPLTRGSLYPLGLCGADLEQWMRGTQLSPDEIDSAFRLATFLFTQIKAGRNKITLLLPKEYAGIALWTKQNFEESLGKSEQFGLKIVIGEKVKLASYHAPKAPEQDRCFVAAQFGKADAQEMNKVAALKRAGYPVAVLTQKPPSLSRYMQFMHYVVFGLAWHARMNFVTQPNVELYKTITNKLHSNASRNGGIESTRDWLALNDSARRWRWRQVVTVNFDRVPEKIALEARDAASNYAQLLQQLAGNDDIEYGELTFFGDTRYSPSGKRVRKVLDRAADAVFRDTLRMPADVYEGPAMNHSYHEMIIGHGRALSTVIIHEAGDDFKPANYTPDYHRAQFLATQMALSERKRPVVAITLKDLSTSTVGALDEFFVNVAKKLKGRKAVG